MPLNLRNLALFVLLGGAAVATWMLAREPVEPVANEVAGDARPRGYFLVDAVLLGASETGHILYRAYVDRVEKLIGDENFVLDGIRIEYAPDSDIHWQVFANRGMAPIDLAFFELSDGVRLNYADTARGNEAVIETESMYFDAQNKLVRSEDSVTLVSSDAEASGTGLEANLGDDTLSISSLSIRSNGAARTRP